MRKNTTIFQRMQSSHNNAKYNTIGIYSAKIPQYFKECNQVTTLKVGVRLALRAKIPQYFKECNQVTTECEDRAIIQLRKNTTIFQRMQSSHNTLLIHNFFVAAQKYHNISKNAIKSQQYDPFGFCCFAQKYHNISKNAIKSQLTISLGTSARSAKIPQYFKECNQVTTKTYYITIISKRKNTTIFQRMQSSHNPFQNLL